VVVKERAGLILLAGEHQVEGMAATAAGVGAAHGSARSGLFDDERWLARSTRGVGLAGRPSTFVDVLGCLHGEDVTAGVGAVHGSWPFDERWLVWLAHRACLAGGTTTARGSGLFDDRWLERIRRGVGTDVLCNEEASCGDGL